MQILQSAPDVMNQQFKTKDIIKAFENLESSFAKTSSEFSKLGKALNNVGASLNDVAIAWKLNEEILIRKNNIKIAEQKENELILWLRN